MSKLGQLSIAVIHYQTPEILRSCLERLERFAAGAALLLIDTSSEPSFIAGVVDRFPDITIIRPGNHSMANAVNAGLKAATTPLIAHMNADVLVEADTFPRLLEALEAPRTAMVGPLCYTPAGRLQRQGILYDIDYTRLLHGRRRSLAVSWLSGCLQVVRREVCAEVGGMDSSLRFYNEDLEWCWRIRKAGYQCRLVKTPVLHLGGSSTPSNGAFLIEGYRGGMVLSLRHRPPWYRWGHRLVVGIAAGWLKEHAKTQEARNAYALVQQMFRSGRFDESPFGSTLDSQNEHFLEERSP